MKRMILAVSTIFAASSIQISAQPSAGRISADTDKSGDARLQALLSETVGKFGRYEYFDEQTGKSLSYNLFIPDGYEPGRQYPLVMFIADASTAGKELSAPLTQGYGGIIWAGSRDQSKHPSFVLVPQYTTVTVGDDFSTSYEVDMTIRLLEKLVDEYDVDRSRIYSTGQSMGGMMSMYFNITYPGLFAASVFVACQWDTSKMAGFARDKFFYIVAAGDSKAPKGMEALEEVLEKEGAEFGKAGWSAKLPLARQEEKVRELLSEGHDINFIVFTARSVLPESGQGSEHMYSFDHAYQLDEVRDWLFRQSK
ncbi:MAG: hypothetical protein LIO77_05110 [Rikenellaceae bacterium]|nr:hypothetical protein [Rikenellaceae bacterium]